MSISSILAASPGTLRAAAGTLTNASGGLSSQASGISAAADGAIGNWTGIAASLCATHCGRLSDDANTGAGALQRAGEALSQLANELDHAQEVARQAQSYAASAESMRAQIAAMESSPMIKLLSADAATAAWQASAAEAEAESIARVAAARAAAILSEVAGMAPSHRDPAWGGVLNLSAQELNAFFSLDLRYLPDQVQGLAGRELAKLVADKTSSQDFEADDIDELFAALGANAYDGDFTAGFFNQLGAAGTADLTVKLVGRFGYFTHEVDTFMQPLSVALGSASREGLDAGFADGLVESFLSEGADTSAYIAHLVQYGTYETDFIVTLAEQGVMRPLAVAGGIANFIATEDGPVDLSGIILEAVARTPEAARTLLLKHFPDDLSVPPGLVGESYLKVLLDAPYADGAAGLNAVIASATNASVPPRAANEVILALIQQAPDVGHGNMFDSTHALIVSIASERWDDFSRNAWAAYNDKDWADGDRFFGGEATNERIRFSMMDALAFMEFAVADAETRAVMKESLDAQVDELIRQALAMPEGSKRDHLLERAGAATELFSLGDTHYRRDYGERVDKEMGQYKLLTKIVSGELIGKFSPGGKAVHLVVKQLAGEAIDNAFKTNNELSAMSATEQQELKYFAELDFKILAYAAEAGILSPEQVAYELDRLRGEGQLSRHDINKHLDLLEGRPYEAMRELRDRWLEKED